MAANADGRFEVFALDANSLMHHIWEGAPDEWSEWAVLDRPGGAGEKDFHSAAEPLVARQRDGRLQVFDVASRKPHANVRWIAQSHPNNGWGPWGDLWPYETDHGYYVEDILADAREPFAVAATEDGRLEVFVTIVQLDEVLVGHISQTHPSNGWADSPAILSERQPVRFSGLATGNHLDGRIVLFGVSNGMLWQIAQTSPNGAWTSWAQLTASVDFSGVPGVGRNKDGRLDVFATGSDGSIWHLEERAPNDNWSPWGSLSGGPFLSSPLVSTDPDGRLHVFALHADFGVRMSHQIDPGGPWSDWVNLGGDRSDEITWLNPYPTLRTPVYGGRDDVQRLRLFAVAGGQLWVRSMPPRRHAGPFRRSP